MQETDSRRSITRGSSHGITNDELDALLHQWAEEEEEIPDFDGELYRCHSALSDHEASQLGERLHERSIITIYGHINPRFYSLLGESARGETPREIHYYHIWTH